MLVEAVAYIPWRRRRGHPSFVDRHPWRCALTSNCGFSGSCVELYRRLPPAYILGFSGGRESGSRPRFPSLAKCNLWAASSCVLVRTSRSCWCWRGPPEGGVGRHFCVRMVNESRSVRSSWWKTSAGATRTSAGRSPTSTVYREGPLAWYSRTPVKQRVGKVLNESECAERLGTRGVTGRMGIAQWIVRAQPAWSCNKSFVQEVTSFMTFKTKDKCQSRRAISICIPVCLASTDSNRQLR